ncbi:hypothetical protein VTP01DRAFT_5753 [Rhizomucor pusillus]|uniref:uncharacterized protein n=1 Tax=Rhizomucor pusillus TaxID=4840 RepID=UPI003743CD72
MINLISHCTAKETKQTSYNEHVHLPSFTIFSVSLSLSLSSSDSFSHAHTFKHTDIYSSLFLFAFYSRTSFILQNVRESLVFASQSLQRLQALQ